jgi:hypothetical protein
MLVAPAGVLALSTLNHNSLAASAFRMQWSMFADEHFTYWNRRALARLFAEYGFEVETYKTYGLGRDFVRWLDRWHRHNDPEHVASESWDVRGPVLRVESVVNRLLRLTGRGAGMIVRLRRRLAED